MGVSLVRERMWSSRYDYNETKVFKNIIFTSFMHQTQAPRNALSFRYILWSKDYIRTGEKQMWILPPVA